MESNSVIKEITRLVAYSIYPMFVLYVNFVFLGLFILDPSNFNSISVIFLFSLFNMFQVLVVIFFVLISTSENKSTQDIFPMTPKHKIERNFRNINPFIAEALHKKSVEKTYTCVICHTYKPPRAHHCSKCNKCFLKMSHHCVFLDSCIGFHNYKFFIQFLVSNVILLAFYLSIITVDEIGNSKLSNTESLVNFSVSVALSAIVLFIVLGNLIQHVKLISNNETVIECKAIDAYLKNDRRYAYVFQEGPIAEQSDSNDRKFLNPYNLGTLENWKDVFGKNILEWISPSFTSVGHGITFRKNYADDDNAFFGE